MLSRIPLIGRVIIALAVVGLVPLAVAFVSLIGANRSAMTLQVLRTHAVAASTVAQRIDGFVDNRAAVAAALAANPEMAADPTSDASRDLMRDQLSADGRLASITILTPDGGEVLRAQRPGTKSLPWVRGATPVALRREGSELLLDVTTQIESRPELLRTVSIASDVEEALRPAEIDEEADVALFDQSGKALLAEGHRADFPPAMIVAGRSARIVGSGEYRFGDREFLGAFAPVGERGWFVLSKQPATVAHALIRNLQKRSLLAALLALTLTALLSLAAYRSIVRPIRDLLHVQQETLGAAAPRSGSEIDQLKATFEILERRVADQKDLGRIFLGRYQILNIIGEGGMGTVFRGWDPKLQRLVALKTVRIAENSAPDRAEKIQALLREAVTVASLNHPNIVAVYDVESSSEAAYVAMELVDGVSLEEHLAATRALPESEAVLIGAAIARGLAAAHGRGVVHHDIKPANVLLGTDGTIKVTDFGISELVSARAAKEKFVFGTPGYIAPERYRGAWSGEASDLFSLGVILYRALTGIRPFEKMVVSDTIHSTLKEAVRPVESHAAGVSPELVRIVMNLLEKDPKQRASSSVAVADALESLARVAGYRWEYRPAASRTAEKSARTHAMFAPTSAIEEPVITATTQQ